MSQPHAPLKPSGADHRPASSEEPARPDPLSGPRPPGALGGRSPWAFVHAVTTPSAATSERAVVAPAPSTEQADGAGDWADDERLDELFSAWAEAALSAEVISERRFMGEEPEAARPEVAPPSAPDREGAASTPVARSSPPPDAPAPSPSMVPPEPAADEHDRWQPCDPWTRADDDIIPRPRPRPRGRWRR